MTALLGFLGILFIALPGISDIIFYRGLDINTRFAGQYFLTPIGMVFFAFCYALLLSVEYEKTERIARELEEQAVIAVEISKQKSEFFAAVNHQMKTPLTVIATDIERAREHIKKGNLEYGFSLMQEALQVTMKLADQVSGAITYARSHDESRAVKQSAFVTSIAMSKFNSVLIFTLLSVSLNFFRKT